MSPLFPFFVLCLPVAKSWNDSTTVCFLYPAYASYKALSLPSSTLESERALERWLMYWAVVGSWTAIEAVVGFTFNWYVFASGFGSWHCTPSLVLNTGGIIIDGVLCRLPFYNIIKSMVFAFLALPQSEVSDNTTREAT